MKVNMKANRKAAAKQAIEKIAAREGISVERVRLEMKMAMLSGLCNQDPKIKSIWESIPRKGEVPEPEELIVWAANRIDSVI